MWVVNVTYVGIEVDAKIVPTHYQRAPVGLEADVDDESMRIKELDPSLRG